MSFKGLDLGTGLAHYSDLMAQGYRDRLDMEQQDMRLQSQLQGQQLHNAIAAQQAASQGLYYNQPKMLQQYGVSPLPVMDPSSEVFQNFKQTNPNAVDDNNFVNPRDAAMLNEAMKRQQQYDALYDRTQLTEQGKNARVSARPQQASLSLANNAQFKSLQMESRDLDNELKQLGDPLKSYQYKQNTGVDPKLRVQQIMARKKEITGIVAQMMPAAAMTQAPQSATPSAVSFDEAGFKAFVQKHKVKDTPANRQKYAELMKAGK